jgi:hypothetical protein
MTKKKTGASPKAPAGKAKSLPGKDSDTGLITGALDKAGKFGKPTDTFENIMKFQQLKK